MKILLTFPGGYLKGLNIDIFLSDDMKGGIHDGSPEKHVGSHSECSAPYDRAVYVLSGILREGMSYKKRKSRDQRIPKIPERLGHSLHGGGRAAGQIPAADT